jgi:hypothetical protein
MSDMREAPGAAAIVRPGLDELAARVSDMLDLRHIDLVSRVRAQDTADLAREARCQAQSATGETLVGWAWALATDVRPEVSALGQRLMADVYVRGLQTLARRET